MIKDSGDRTEFETGAKRSALVRHHGGQQALRGRCIEVRRAQRG